MHDLTIIQNTYLIRRFQFLQNGPTSWREAREFYCGDEDCPWDSLDAIEAELALRGAEVVR